MRPSCSPRPSTPIWTSPSSCCGKETTRGRRPRANGRWRWLPTRNRRLIFSVHIGIAAFSHYHKTVVAKRCSGGAQRRIVNVIRAGGKNRAGGIGILHLVNFQRTPAREGHGCRRTGGGGDDASRAGRAQDSLKLTGLQIIVLDQLAAILRQGCRGIIARPGQIRVGLNRAIGCAGQPADSDWGLELQGIVFKPSWCRLVLPE